MINSMKGWIPVEIPTKKYLKAYIISSLGPKPKMDGNHFIGKKLEDLLEHKTNEYRSDFKNNFNCTVRIYITKRAFNQRGANLNETNIKNFNRFIELIIKSRYYELMDDFIEILPSFEAHLPEVRRRLGISIEDWSDESMQKDYYRYRLKSGKKKLYSKSKADQFQPSAAAPFL